MEISAQSSSNISFVAWLKAHVLYDYRSILKTLIFWAALALLAYLI